jgi:hypothetical protein
MAEKSNMTREWIERVWTRNPCVTLPNGKIRLGPCRLAFTNLIERPKPGKDGKERSHGTVILIPDMTIPGVNIDPLYEAATELYRAKAPGALTNEDLRARYHNPFKKQQAFIELKTGELYDGFVPGRIAISANSPGSAPRVVDARMMNIDDKDKCYSGCWAIPVLNPAWIGRQDNPGPTFYLDIIQVVADDEDLRGAGSSMSPQDAFGGVQIDAEVNPAGMFGGEDKEALAKKALFG